MKYYAGLDVSMSLTAICIVDEDGKVICEKETDSFPKSIAKQLVLAKVPLEKIALETGPISHHLIKGLCELGLPVVCVDARHLNAFLSVKINKTDRNDARGIAEALRCQAYKEVHIKSDTAMATNAVVNLRESMVESRVKLTNSIRGILKPFGIRSLGPSTSGSKFIESCQKALERVPTELRLASQSILKSIELIYIQIKELDRQLELLATGDEQVQLLRTVPGVGPITALRFKHAIDDVSRFKDCKAIGAYLGLTPNQYSSGEISRQGRISKRGSKRLRRTLVEAAGVLLTRTKSWSRLKAWGMKIAKKKGFRKATIAVARKLSIILYRMLETGEEFRLGDPKPKAG